MKIKLYDHNNVFQSLASHVTLVEDLDEADALLVYQDIFEPSPTLISRAKASNKPSYLFQHGLYSTRAYYGAFDSKYVMQTNKMFVWGIEDKKRLMNYGYKPEEIIITGAPILRKPVKPNNNEQGVVIFSHTKWDKVIDENFLIRDELRKIPNIKLITKMVSSMIEFGEKLEDYDNPIVSDPTKADHLDIVYDVLYQADLVVSSQEGTLELLSHYLGIPVIVTDVWKPKKIHELYYSSIDDFISSACYRTQLKDMAQAVENVLANSKNDLIKKYQRRAFLNEFAFSPNGTPELIVKATIEKDLNII